MFKHRYDNDGASVFKKYINFLTGHNPPHGSIEFLRILVQTYTQIYFIYKFIVKVTTRYLR